VVEEEEKAWARSEQDPIKVFEEKYIAKGVFTEDELKDARKEVLADVKVVRCFCGQLSNASC
jgi:TPP-dependent pyruvate/acetoin dehydrogenase alpha subunit